MPNPAAHGTLTVALISEVFFDADAAQRLRASLAAARSAGAELAVLPEIPLNPWSPATTDVRDEDAEGPSGPRRQLLSRISREVGIAVIGGAIVRDPADGQRRNTALVFDAQGQLLESYAKLHLPEEPGFWETSHYVPGSRPARVIDAFGLPLGVQICSDINRPEGSHALAAAGAQAILAPRATEQRTFGRWRVVFRATALTSAAFVLSVNRPRPEGGVLLGGPSIAVAPDGTVLLETTDPLAIVKLDGAAVAAAHKDYPGYLPIRARLYADAWDEIARGGG
jgi:predicted amidohydrolase